MDVFFVAVFAGVIGLGPRLLNMDGDLGRHLVVGGYILNSRTIPRADIFSHTMSWQPLTPHEWLAEVIFALVFRLGGLDGVVFLCALLLALTFSLVYRQATMRSGRLLLPLGLSIVAAAAASLHWLARPHLFTMLFTVLWTGMLERLRRGESPSLWIFPGLMLLWANLHGAFIAGFAIWGMFLIGESIEYFIHRKENKQTVISLCVVGFLSFLASLANPSGFGLWFTSLGYLRNGYLVGHTAEYLPPDIHQPSTWPFFSLVLFSFLVALRARGRIAPVHMILLAGWAVMACISARNIPLFAVIAAPILAECLIKPSAISQNSQVRPSIDASLYAIESSLGGHLWAAAVLILAPMLFVLGIPLDFGRQGNHFDQAVFPVSAADWLERQPQTGAMFNYFPWGGYLLYRFWPSERVFIDGQTDFYGERLTRQYEQVITLAGGWQNVLSRYRIDWVIIPVDSELATYLQTQPEWKALYRDQTAVIFSMQSEKTNRMQGSDP